MTFQTPPQTITKTKNEGAASGACLVGLNLARVLKSGSSQLAEPIPLSIIAIEKKTDEPCDLGHKLPTYSLKVENEAVCH